MLLATRTTAGTLGRTQQPIRTPSGLQQRHVAIRSGVAPSVAPKASWPLLRPRLAPVRAAEEEEVTPAAEPDAAFEALKASAGTQKNLSFVAFWLQLALTLVSAGVLLFSVFVTSTSTGAGKMALDITKGFTLVGVLLAFISTFFAHGFLRLARRLSAGNAVDVNWLRNTLNANNTVNLLGIGVTTIGLQASVGTLVGKTLLAATSSSLQYNPSASLVSLDVFALQASTNILLCHLIGLTFASLMMRVLRSAAPQVQAAL